MAEPLGKREMIAWTIAGVLAVVAGIAYSKRPADSTPVQPQLNVQSPLTTPVKFDSAPPEKVVFVKGDSTVKYQEVQRLAEAEVRRLRDSIARLEARRRQDSLRSTVVRGPLPPPEMSTPLTKREPSSNDTVWVRIGTRRYQATIYVNGESRGELNLVRWVPVPRGTVRMSIRAPDCQAWDTTFTPVRDSVTMGMRMPRC